MGEAESVPVAVPVPVVLVPSGEAPSGLAVASARIFFCRSSDSRC